MNPEITVEHRNQVRATYFNLFRFKTKTLKANINEVLKTSVNMKKVLV